MTTPLLHRLEVVEHHRRFVVGYHGTESDSASTIVSEERFLPSTLSHEWLGDGIYFWEGNPHRAWKWARERFPGRAAVVRASIDLGYCLDLIGGVGHDLLRAAYADLSAAFRARGEDLPMNRSTGAHRLDYAVFNRACELCERVQTLRALFAEGDEIYPGAASRTLSHIQVCVRDAACIRPPIALMSLSEVP